MFFTYWNDGKINISSFKSAILLAGFLHQQFCFLRQKISFFHFDCKQIGGCPLIHPRLCVHASRRWCGINNKFRSKRKTNNKQTKKKAYFSNYSTWLSLARFLCQKHILHEIIKAFQKVDVHYLFTWYWTIGTVWQCKEICQALGKFNLSRGICWWWLLS